MIVALFTNLSKNHSKAIAIGIKDFLTSRDVEVYADDKDAHHIGVKPLSSIDPKKVNYIITLGGDGTILWAFHAHPTLEAPIMGINLGTLGFMADIAVEEIYPALENLLAGRFNIQNRIMMEGESMQHEKCFAINEISIHRAKNPSLIDLAIYVDGNYLNTFSADGIIVATPNGSTAYSLAAGGPIMSPDLEALVLTPISPHTISNRPIVLWPKQEIQVRYLGEHSAVEVTYDSFGHFTLHPGEIFHITNSSRKFRLVNMYHYDYFATLRSKLGWSGRLKK